ncbi:MAG: citrate synthase [Planctomycetia bacterium]|nr:citrate synthase [Planctomycetia bacterium]
MKAATGGNAGGLEGIVAGQTAVCTLAGRMLYRGYPIEELAAESTFEEVAYLLLYGELPSSTALAEFRIRIGAEMTLPPAIVDTLRSIPAATPGMDVMRTGCSMLAHFDAETADDTRPANLRKAERLLAKLPLIMATKYRLDAGLKPLAAEPDRSIAENILRQITDRKPEPRAVQALDTSLILYAEHEFNASTFTARCVASTLADLHSAVTAAIGALKGPLHGGANERVLEVLRQVGAPANAEPWIRQALANKVRIMGFGHRVYKHGDPRTVIITPLCAELAQLTGNEAMEQTAATIERIIVADKSLPANVDWPSARLYHYLGLPVSLYTPLFVCARVSGWSAHVMEQLENNRLIRPAAEYIGPEQRKFVPITKR